LGGRLHPQEAGERLGQRSANATGLGKFGDRLGVVVRLSAHTCQAQADSVLGVDA